MLFAERVLSECQIFLFFFFQAEDGIRDVAVTGVQTCALPIYRAVTFRSAATWPLFAGADVGWNQTAQVSLQPHPVVPGRSEERRVGKECRSRWSPYH